MKFTNEIHQWNSIEEKINFKKVLHETDGG